MKPGTVKAADRPVIRMKYGVVGSQILSSVTGSGNTYPQVYDALGRYFYAGITLDF